MEEIEQQINNLWSMVDELDALGYKDKGDEIRALIFKALEKLPQNEIFIKTVH
jgi:hypothetical protein